MPRANFNPRLPLACHAASFRDLQDAYFHRFLRLRYEQASRSYVVRQRSGELVKEFGTPEKAREWLDAWERSNAVPV